MCLNTNLSSQQYFYVIPYFQKCCRVVKSWKHLGRWAFINLNENINVVVLGFLFFFFAFHNQMPIS